MVATYTKQEATNHPCPFSYALKMGNTRCVWLLHIIIGKYCYKDTICFSPQVLVYMANAAVSLFKALAMKLQTCTPHCVDVLKSSISLALLAVSQLKTLYPNDEKHQEDKIIAHFDKLKCILCEWIVSCDVIGGSLFGGSLPSSTSSWKHKEELEVMYVYWLIHAHKSMVCPFFSYGSPFLLWSIHLISKLKSGITL